MRYGQNIKIVGGNDFDLLEPIYIRTYSNGTPIDTRIDALTIDDLVVKLNGVVFNDFEQVEEGIILHIPAEIEKNTYNIEYNGVYTDKAIRSAHFEAFTIVSWDEQADAIDYIEGSPIVLNGAYIIDANRGIIASQQETIRSQEITIETQEGTIASQERVIESQEIALASQQATIASQQSESTSKQATISSQQSTLASQQSTIAQQDGTLNSQQSTISSQQSTTASQQATISSQQSSISGLQSDLHGLQQSYANVATLATQMSNAFDDYASQLRGIIGVLPSNEE